MPKKLFFAEGRTYSPPLRAATVRQKILPSVYGRFTDGNRKAAGRYEKITLEVVL